MGCIMKKEIIIFCIFTSVFFIGCIQNSDNEEERIIEIIFNENVSINEAKECLLKYNITLTSIDIDKYVFNDGDKELVTAYADVNDDIDIDKIISDIDDEDIVWRCIRIYSEG